MPRMPPQHSSMPGVDREPRRRDAVVVGVGRADRGEDLAARLEVVVVAPHACVGEALRLLRLEQAERARDFEPGFALDSVDGLDDLREQSLLGAAHGDDDAELRRAGVTGRARGADDVVEVEERVDVDLGLELRRLRAERAVFGARARLGVDQALELHLGPAPREADLMGERHEVGETVQRDGGSGTRLVTCECAAFDEERVLGVGERRFGSHGEQRTWDTGDGGESAGRPRTDPSGTVRGTSGLHRARCWVTPSRGDPQESATENRPPMAACSPEAAAQVRVKRCGKSAPASGVTRMAWQTPPGARSDRGRAARPPTPPGRPLELSGNRQPRGMAAAGASAPDRIRRTGRLATTIRCDLRIRCPRCRRGGRADGNTPVIRGRSLAASLPRPVRGFGQRPLWSVVGIGPGVRVRVRASPGGTACPRRSLHRPLTDSRMADQEATHR